VKNYAFDYNFGNSWGHCNVICTSVAGHLTAQDFPRGYGWSECDPYALFDAPIEKTIPDNNKSIAENIKRHAVSCSVLYIWTDCDREGENIGAEIRDLALRANRRLEVRRAHFSNVERSHIIQAARNPASLDERQASAVEARIEIDLRTGAAFTRILTLTLRPMVQAIQPDLKTISYGSCQFPTLGFVVDRYFKVQRFVPEPYWSMKMIHKKEELSANFTWARGPLFDRMAVVILYERCLLAKKAKVVKMIKKPTSKWRPLPLTTVELQKNATRFLGMNSQRAMKVSRPAVAICIDESGC
jgi:DNA topoisomerase III